MVPKRQCSGTVSGGRDAQGIVPWSRAVGPGACIGRYSPPSLPCRPGTWIQAYRGLADLLTNNGLAHVTVQRGAATRERGKYRLVQPLHHTNPMIPPVMSARRARPAHAARDAPMMTGVQLGRVEHHEVGRAFRAYVAEHAADPELRGSAAAALGWSLRHVQVALEAADTTPSEVIRRERLSLARELLGDGRLRISDIAFASGLSSVNTSTDAFRREFCGTPRSSRSWEWES